MAVGMVSTTKSPEEMTAAVMPRIESHLQMMWVQTEWVNEKAVERIDAPLRGYVTQLLDESETLSAFDVVKSLSEDLLSYFGRCVKSKALVDDALMRPIVERFGAALLQLADAAEGHPLRQPGELVDGAYDGIDSLLTGFALRPQNVNQEVFHQLHTYLHEAVENADDELVVRTYLRDRLYNLRETLRSSSNGVGGAIAALDRLLDDPILVG